MDESQVDAYLARLGAERPARPDLPGLRALQRAHLGAVPFENLSIALGEPIVLDQAALVAKVVDRRRGGFCYELNGAFAALLTALGYRVSLLSARVLSGPTPGPPFDHLTLRVDLDEPWLVDVGFGRFAHHPLRLDSRDGQADPAGTFTVVEQGPDLDVLCDGEPQYRVDQRPYSLDDFKPTCWWQATSPDSHFTQHTTCSRLTDTGRITIADGTLISTVDGRREDLVLDGDQAVLDAYREHFGIVLDRAALSGRPCS